VAGSSPARGSGCPFARRALDLGEALHATLLDGGALPVRGDGVGIELSTTSGVRSLAPLLTDEDGALEGRCSCRAAGAPTRG
jgi:hypothetical protein